MTRLCIPLADLNDLGPDLEGDEIMESVAQKISLRHLVRIDDDFNDNVIDEGVWNVTAGIAETGQRLEISGSGNWNQRGIISNDAFSVGCEGDEMRVTFYTGTSEFKDRFFLGLLTASAITTTPEIGLYVAYSGNRIYARAGANSYDTGHTWAWGKTYTLRMVYGVGGWDYYLQSDDDINYNAELRIYTLPQDIKGTFFWMLQTQAAQTVWVDNAYYAAGYSVNSPSPSAYGWLSYPAGLTIDLSTASIYNETDGVPNGYDSVDFKVRYSANGGAASAWMTLESLRDAGVIAITDSINSLRVEGQWNSDGTRHVKAQAYLMAEALMPESSGPAVFMLPLDAVEVAGMEVIEI